MVRLIIVDEHCLRTRRRAHAVRPRGSRRLADDGEDFQAGLAAGSIFLPSPTAWVWAQSEGAVKLLRLPKVALVIGNCAYKRVPVLKNPANDASAMAQVLREAGFEVTLRLEATQKEMREAFQAHGLF